ncbi:MAG TPA: DUF5666 domain-containing protein [Actinomycetota bacterium]|nr:DUF5666 domain-containing protein [Actinomycetota bacterium]
MIVTRAAAGASDPGDPLPLFTGYVEAVEHPRAAVVAAHEHGSVRVDFTPQAVFVRDGEVPINAFEVGDHVAVTGTWNGDGATGDGMEVLYELREGRINARSQDRLDTTAGPIRLIDKTQPEGGPDSTATPVEELEPGDVVRATGRIDPGAGEFVALRIGVVHG